MNSVSIIKLLSDGEFHSGEELGRFLGVSRTAVWKQLKKIEDFGLSVQSVKGKGYRLGSPLELLDRDLIEKNLTPESRRLLNGIHLLEQVDSTNSQALSACQTVDATGNAWLAEWQTGGRGRRGRQWQSPYGRNIYLSLVWGFQEGVAGIEGLSLAVGVAIRRAIANCGISQVSLKWPNDLLLDNKKVGGILLEVTGDPAGFCQVVIGVGINIGMSPDQGTEIDQPWVDLMGRTEHALSRNKLAWMCLNELLPMLRTFETHGFGPFRDEWQQYDSCSNQPVVVITGNTEQKGIARGVTDNGALCLEVEGRLELVYGGEVSLRKADATAD